MLGALGSPDVLTIPVSDELRSRMERWLILQWVFLGSGALLAVVLAVAFQNTTGVLMFMVGLVAGGGAARFAAFRANPVGADGDGDQLILARSHPAFAQAMAALNPPGLVQTEPAVAPGHR